MLTIYKPCGEKNRQASAGNQGTWVVKELNDGKSTLSHEDTAKNQMSPITDNLPVKKKENHR